MKIVRISSLIVIFILALIDLISSINIDPRFYLLILYILLTINIMTEFYFKNKHEKLTKISYIIYILASALLVYLVINQIIRIS